MNIKRSKKTFKVVDIISVITYYDLFFSVANIIKKKKRQHTIIPEQNYPITMHTFFCYI